MKQLFQKIIILCIALAMVLACVTAKDSTRTKAEGTVVNGENLYAAALLDRQKKEEGKEKIKKFLKEIASAYKLSATTPEIDDNGDGTANVKFMVNADIDAKVGWGDPGTVDAGAGTIVIKKVTGVNLAEFLSTGLKVERAPSSGNYSIKTYCPDRPKCGKYEEIKKFMDIEEKKLVLFVKLGEFEDREGRFLYLRFKKTYKIKMSLEELKSLSQLKLKVLYDSEEFGQ